MSEFEIGPITPVQQVTSAMVQLLQEVFATIESLIQGSTVDEISELVRTKVLEAAYYNDVKVDIDDIHECIINCMNEYVQNRIDERNAEYAQGIGEEL